MTFGRSLSRNIAGALGVVVLSTGVFGGIAMIGDSDAPITAAGESDADHDRDVDTPERDGGTGGDEVDGEVDTDALDDRGASPSGDGDGDGEEPDDTGGSDEDEDSDSDGLGVDDAGHDADAEDPAEEPGSEESSAEESTSDEEAEEPESQDAASDEQEADESESTDADGDDHEHPRIDPASIDLQVLDGFQSDGGAAAASIAEQLRGAGYRVVAENPALRYDVTTVLWSQGGEAQARQVAAEIGAAEVRRQPGNLSESVAVHVVVGADRG